MDLAWRGKIEASEAPEPRPGASTSRLARPRTPPERGASTAGARLDPSGSASPVHSQAQEMSYPQPCGRPLGPAGEAGGGEVAGTVTVLEGVTRLLPPDPRPPQPLILFR